MMMVYKYRFDYYIYIERERKKGTHEDIRLFNSQFERKELIFLAQSFITVRKYPLVSYYVAKM